LVRLQWVDDRRTGGRDGSRVCTSHVPSDRLEDAGRRLRWEEQPFVRRTHAVYSTEKMTSVADELDDIVIVIRPSAATLVFAKEV